MYMDLEIREIPIKGSKNKVIEAFGHEGITTIEHLADVSGLSRPTVRKYLAELELEGRVQLIRCGNAKIFLPIEGEANVL